jgi:mono/diheme cytochrome c family protein
MLAVATWGFALVLGVVLLIAWVIYGLVNAFGKRSHAEVGAELELAPNRKPYYDDEALEGPRMERFQVFGLITLAVIVIALPLYWLFEPSRQAGARDAGEAQLAKWGGQLFAPTAEGGFNCAGCHGGMKATGGAAPYTITDKNTGAVRSVTWNAPALNTVLYRFSEEEVRFILVYGRQFSPMSPWGIAGGGPMNDQQITSIIAYLKSIQLPADACPAGANLCEGGRLPADKQAEIQKAIDDAMANGTASSVGEAIFNLTLDSGAYSCARCHTSGWSFGNPLVTAGGAFGPNLTSGAEVRQFPNAEDNLAFVQAPPENGKKYGQQGQSSGRMPAFGMYYTAQQLAELVEYIRSL